MKFELNIINLNYKEKWNDGYLDITIFYIALFIHTS